MRISPSLLLPAALCLSGCGPETGGAPLSCEEAAANFRAVTTEEARVRDTCTSEKDCDLVAVAYDCQTSPGSFATCARPVSRERAGAFVVAVGERAEEICLATGIETCASTPECETVEVGCIEGRCRVVDGT